MAVPPAIIWTLTAVGAAIVAKLVLREWQRVNADLERLKTAPVREPDRHMLPKLRRDPVTGEYRIM
jgi:hypothetical protein